MQTHDIRHLVHKMLAPQLKTDLDSGHGGASGRYEYLKEIALKYTFLLTVFEQESNV